MGQLSDAELAWIRGDEAAIVGRDSKGQVAEAVAWSRSQPGSGPIPVYPEPDKAVTQGWRIDSPPAAFE